MMLFCYLLLVAGIATPFVLVALLERKDDKR
jgi:hypothetical protein